MDTSADETKETPDVPARNTDSWAPLVQTLQVKGMPANVPDLVDGRRLVGPLQGFGKMWQKTYRVRLPSEATDPKAVIRVWKDEFPSFWPAGNRFYTPLVGISPGEVALISLSAGPMRLSTGVMVLYADLESFTLMTPQGHMFAGWITFSAFKDNEDCVVQTQVLMRAQDPLSEVGLMMGGHKAEDRFWASTLRAVALRMGHATEPETTVVCIDPRRRWSEARNIWHNAGLRSTLHMVTTPLRLPMRLLRRGDR
jgi:hypothetical protein